MAVQNALGSLAGVETLLFVTFAQRVLLLLAIAYAIWLWRWRPLPLVVLVVAPSVVAYTNLIMTEGPTIPLSILLSCFTAHYLMVEEGGGGRVTVGRGSMPSETVRTLAVWGAIGCALWLLLVRLPWAVFGFVPLAIWLFSRRPRLETILATDASTVDDAIHVNLVSQTQGRDVFIDTYNEGHKP